MSNSPSEVQELIIPALTPSFLERGEFWFEKNKHRIKEAAEKHAFWKEHVYFLKTGSINPLSGFLRKLDDLGYEKVQTISLAGEYSLAGGVLTIIPLNAERIYQIDFLGNRVERILQNPLSRDDASYRKTLQQKLNRMSLRNLKRGDFLVHTDHGIGKFAGIAVNGDMRGDTIKNHIQENEKQFYVLEYAEGDRLYVPVGLEKKLSRYIGFSEPKISRLGSPLWEHTKRRIKENAVLFAKNLIALYAKREIVRRPAYPRDPETERMFAASFEYEETPDQLMALQDISRDMSRETPMDRIVCGDVGFGKTEVAVRATFRAVHARKQVALITPTTILAWQHFQTFSSRLTPYGVRVEMLSRLESRKNERHTLERLKEGSVDVIVGTHRLLSKDVSFKNLGLLIIDEEQKFGVRQKESFKELRAEIDILSLSATPIPRTLYLALSHLRKMSIIQTPPPGRRAIKTIVEPWDETLAREAIEEELSRKGQVYVLYNKVATIGLIRDEIQGLAPLARIEIAHGKLPEQELIEKMKKFKAGHIDILVATTIIENGIDLPTVNTLIVKDSVRLGLAQAHQIRGRIGRSDIQAYAYFFYPPTLMNIVKKPLKKQRRVQYEKAFERLQALKEAEELGSGYELALRDLEIRGAGNILGKEQSGSVNKVGLNLYCQILAEAVEQVKTGKSSLLA